MKYNLPVKVLTILGFFLCTNVQGQGVMQATKISALQTSGTAWNPAQLPDDINIPKGNPNKGHSAASLQKPLNYTSFSEIKINKSAEAIAANAGYERHPELGLLYPGAPCGNCYEVLGERTENTKTFVQEGTVNGKKHKFTQTSTQPMHYKDAAGNWRTIITHLQADAVNGGVYTIAEEATPVIINTNAGSTFSALGRNGENIKFNHNLELIYVQPDGKEMALGTADYTHHTTGDQGMYITNAWPGIDIEMNVLRGAIKTNFHINHAMPEYAAGKLLVRDHLEMDKDLSLYTQGKTQLEGELQIQDQAGVAVYGIGAANVYEEKNPANTQSLVYYIGNNNTLDIALPGVFLNKAGTSYPIIIDPLVTLATTTNPSGSSYNALWTPLMGCTYTNAANTPANCTVTDINFTFSYTTAFPMAMEYGAFSFYIGTCRSPGTPPVGDYSWSCADPAYGVCATAAAISIYSDVATCLPAPSCASIPLNVTMYFYQNYHNTAACATTWCYGSAPLVFTVEGETVALTSTSSSGSITVAPSVVCQGNSSTLSATGVYGVPPYTYTWAPGAATGSPVTVTPSVTTTYTVTLTDACGNTSTDTATITVNPLATIMGIDSVCTGSTTTLTASASGSTWSSTNTAIATIDPATGIVTGISTGVTTISYGVPGCAATVSYTVNPTPATPVADNSSPVCQGSSISFTATGSTATASYIWSGPGGFSSIQQDPVIGSATLAAAGTYTVTAVIGACSAPPVTTVVVVNTNPVLSTSSFTNPTACLATDGSITIHDGALPGGTSYTVSYADNGTPSTASITSDGSGNIIITGLGAGTYTTISAASSVGCMSNTVGPVTLIDPVPPPPPVFTANLPLCVGQTLFLSVTDDTSGGVYTLISPDGTTITMQNLTVPGITYSDSGIYTVNYDIANCISTSTLDVPLYPPVILTDLTANTTVAYGGSIHLNASGAQYYWWSPDNGSLSNPNINDPIATPLVSTVYTVIGTSIYGCMDTANITIDIDTATAVFIPTAFTPNGDGRNDVFKIGNLKHMQLVDFSIFNRWGQLVYHNTYNADQGWDGTWNGVAQDIGVYNYVVTLSYPDGGTQSFKGDVTLIR